MASLTTGVHHGVRGLPHLEAPIVVCRRVPSLVLLFSSSTYSLLVISSGIMDSIFIAMQTTPSSISPPNPNLHFLHPPSLIVCKMSTPGFRTIFSNSVEIKQNSFWMAQNPHCPNPHQIQPVTFNLLHQLQLLPPKKGDIPHPQSASAAQVWVAEACHHLCHPCGSAPNPSGFSC